MVPTAPQGLHTALLEATAATWDLARSASGPAERISRQVLDVTSVNEPDSIEPAIPPNPDRDPNSSPEPAPAPGSLSVPSLAALGPDPAAASVLLQQVGDHVAEGVRPLSNSARQAFGFLLGPALDQPGAGAKPPTSKGA
jgi:hypothetical protein